VSDTYYHDDPIEPETPKRKKTSALAALVLFAVGGFYLQSTLAANLSVSSGRGIQFGQGIIQTVACSGATVLTLTPSSSFVNASGAGGHKFSSVTVSNIPSGCNGYDFTINAYGDSDNTPLALFNSTSTSAVVYDNAGTFQVGLGGTGTSITSGSGTFTVTFTTPVATAASVFKITMQSAAHSSFVSLLAAADMHNCVIISGAVKCWGYNGEGELGNGRTTNSWTPVSASGLSSGVTALASGAFHSCAVTSTGTVKCWGDNYFGGLGDGTTDSSSVPVPVTGLTGAAGIATSNAQSCAVLISGGAKCWGYNEQGQLGDGTTTNRLTPTSVSGLSSGVVAIGMGDSHSCALLSSGAVKCWGDNFYGELGDGTTTNRLTPTAVSGLSSGVTAIAIGHIQSCALLNSGAVKCWGYNSQGQLGDGTTTNRLIPTAVSGLSSGVTAIATSVGGNHSCAVLSSGTVQCWGNNYSGQLGDGSTTQSLTPVSVSGLSSSAITVATGQDHTCALLAAGSVQCWGNNSYGQLGDGTGSTSNRYSPLNVISLF